MSEVTKTAKICACDGEPCSGAEHKFGCRNSHHQKHMKTIELNPGTTEAEGWNTRGSLPAAGPAVLHISNILVPLDFSEMALKALRYAVPFAKQFGAKLTLVHIMEQVGYAADMAYLPMPPDAIRAAESAIEEIRDKNIPPEISTDIIVRVDFTTDALLAAARNSKADLIITTTHGRTGLKHLFLGSVAERIVREAPCPVLVVRDQERDFV